MQGLPASAFNLTKTQAILNEIGLGQIALEDEVNTSIAEHDSVASCADSSNDDTGPSTTVKGNNNMRQKSES